MMTKHSPPNGSQDVRVAGRALEAVAWLVKRYGLDVPELVRGLQIMPLDLERPPTRIPWHDFAVLQERVAAEVGDRDALREAGRVLLGGAGLGPFTRALTLVANSQAIFALGPKYGLPTLFPMVSGAFRRLDDRHSVITCALPPGYTPSRAFFEITAGNFEAVPTLIGDPPAVVNLETDGTTAHFTIEHAASRTLWTRLAQFGRLLFASRSVIAEMAARNEELARELSASASAKERAERAIAAQDALMSAVSHELRTPLAAVVGLLALAREKELPAEAGELLRGAEEAAQNLAKRVEVIVQVASLGGAASEERAEPLDVGACVLGIYQRYRRVSELQVRMDLPEGAPRLLAPAGWVERIVEELVSNAYKFTPSGEVRIRVEIEDVAVDRCALTLKVSDTGPGIPAAWRHRVFEPFVRVDSRLARGTDGLGLGLTLVKTLTERMGGEVKLGGGVGVGTTVKVRLTLPRAPVGEKTASTPRVREVAPPPLRLVEPPSEPTSSEARTKLLVVDDNPTNRLLLTRMGERLGYTTKSATDGAEALEALDREPFDLVFMDVQMPNMDGLEATRRVRAREGDRHTPIIAVTAQVAPGDEARCRDAGMDAYVPKPVALPALQAAIEEAFAASVSRRAV